jgi:hypothetical protein
MPLSGLARFKTFPDAEKELQELEKSYKAIAI